MVIFIIIIAAYQTENRPLFYGQVSTASTRAVGAEMLKSPEAPKGRNPVALQDTNSTAYVQQAEHGLQSQNTNLKESLSVIFKDKNFANDQLPHSIS